MNLIKVFKSLIEGGVIVKFKLSAAGEGKVQLDILPEGKDTKTGMGLPPVALVGTADELDEQLEAYLVKYAATVSNIAQTVANADAELKAIEESAMAQARATVEAKKKPITPSKPGASKPGTVGPKRDMTAGLINGDDDDDEGAGTGTGTGNDGNDDDAVTALDTSGGATTPADTLSGGNAAGDQQQGSTGSGLSPDLFNV